MTVGSEQKTMSSKNTGEKRMSRKAFIFICLLPTVFLPAGSMAQQPGKIPRIGYLSSASATSASFRTEPFRRGLRDLGYVEGTNIAV
jgi:putative tryptophan/tyrosine transport system substrate-binding protein